VAQHMERGMSGAYKTSFAWGSIMALGCLSFVLGSKDVASWFFAAAAGFALRDAMKRWIESPDKEAAR
jgi:short subunit dehydrogenase-like uncharacterized protein